MGNKIENRSLFKILPILLIIFIVPISVHLKIVSFSGDFYTYYTGTTDYDFYSYYKMLFFLIFTGIAFTIITFKFCIGDIEFKKTIVNYYMAVYSIFVFLSLLISTHKNEALWGFMGRYEGTIVLLGYIFMCLYAVNMIEGERDIWFAIYTMGASTILVCLVGLSQLIGHDFLQTSFGKQLIAFGIKGFNIKDMVFTLPKYTVYGTLYHSDYMGSFAAMTFIIFLSLFFILKGKRQKLLFGILSLVVFLNLIGSQSRAGIFSAFVAVVILFILYNKYLLNIWKQLLAVSIAGILILVAANEATGGSIASKIKSLYLNTNLSINAAKLEDVRLSPNSIQIKTSSVTLNVQVSKDGISFRDSDGEKIKTQLSDGKFTFNDDRYKDYFVNIGNVDKNTMLAVHIKDMKLTFAYTKDGLKFENSRNELVDLPDVKSLGFQNNEQLGSGRGYIWSRTLPLLKDTIFVGHGADTFTMYFPQDDYIGKLITYGDMKIYVDKPHDMYLQTAVNTGVISLIALFGIFGTYIIQSIKLYLKNDFSDIYSAFGISIFGGIVAYLMAGFFNDSVLSVAPLFWILLGTGISINLKVSGAARKLKKS